MTTHAMRIYDASGARLYLSAAERDAFKKAADNGPRLVRTLCLTLLYTGCRISEALELTGDRVDFQDKTLRWTCWTSCTPSGRRSTKAAYGPGSAARRLIM
jgi:hypothetical protein